MSDTAGIVTSLATVSIAFSTAAQALAALYNLKDKSSITDEAYEHIENIRASLSELEEVGHYLRESKELHDHLNRVSLHTGRMKDQYIRALHNRVFIEEDYNVGKTLDIWDDSSRDFIDLNNFLLNDMNLVDTKIIKRESKFIGSEWAILFPFQYETINEMMSQRERGNAISKIKFAEEINILHAGTQNALSLANTKIRKSASEIADGFLLFSEKLSNENI